MSKKFSVSLACSMVTELYSNVEVLNHYVDYFHIDIMDNHYVQNLGLSYDQIKDLRNFSRLPFDFHLMVDDPEIVLKKKVVKPGDIVSMHLDSLFGITDIIDGFKNEGAKVLLAMHPLLPVKILDLIIDKIDGINYLTVNPGYVSQAQYNIAKKQAKNIGEVIAINNIKDFIFEVDGNMTFENIGIFSNYGADYFVLGTSSIFPNNKLDIIKLKHLKQYNLGD